MSATPEDILDKLSTIIMDLGSIREQVTDSVDRSAINNQIRALTKWWRAIDDERAGQTNEEIDRAQTALNAITRDLKKEKKELKRVATVIHRAAQAIGVAEKVLKAIV